MANGERGPAFGLIQTSFLVGEEVKEAIKTNLKNIFQK